MIRSTAQRSDPVAYRQAHVWYAGERYSRAEQERRQAAWHEGEDWPDDVRVLVGDHEHDGQSLTHVVVHSPSGLEWGYGGSGPSDLALSILTDFLGEDPEAVKAANWSHLARPSLALKLHHVFVATVIADLGVGPGNPSTWLLSGTGIRHWLDHDPRALRAIADYQEQLDRWEEWQREDADLAALEADGMPL